MEWVRSGDGHSGKSEAVGRVCKVRVGKIGHAGLIFTEKTEPLPWRRIGRGEVGGRAWEPEQGRSPEHCICPCPLHRINTDRHAHPRQNGRASGDRVMSTEPQACLRPSPSRPGDPGDGKALFLRETPTPPPQKPRPGACSSHHLEQQEAFQSRHDGGQLSPMESVNRVENEAGI